MTVQSSTSSANYTGNGVTTAFTVPFYFLDQTHLTVVRTQISTGVQTTLALTADYTVSGAADPAGGTVTCSVAPTADQKLSILRDVPLTQLTDYVPNDPFPAETHEQALDKLTMEAQQIQEQVGRAVTAPVGDTLVSLTLPSAAVRANKTPVFGASGELLVAATPENAQAAVDAALAQAAIATAEAAIATAGAASAGTSATTAANYAAAAATGAKFYNTIALGNAGVADAATFGVIAGGSDGLTRPTIYRRESAGVSTALYSVLPASEYDALFPQLDGVSPVWGITDDRGNSVIEVASDGTTKAANLVALQTNGLDLRFSARPASLGNFDAERIVLIGEGQSNMQGRVPGVTTAVEYDNIGFAAQASSPSSYSDLTVANCSFGGVQESLIFGALGYIKKLIQQENGLSQTDIAFQLLAGDNSQGSTAIAAHVKGSQYYGYGTSQATAAVSLSATDNKSVMHGGVFWNQGEADSATALATYQAALIQLATDYNTDLKAITGQTKNITLITGQTTSNTANRNIALAQLAAANASALVKMCAPMYQFDYESDGIHVVNRHDYWLGAYYGLVWKRLWVDLLTWKPTQPTTSTKSGKIAYVTFDCMVQPLVLDTTNVPAQTNYGFTLVDSGGTDIPISSVSVCTPNKIKVVASATIPTGAKLRYGFNAATGKGAYTGAAGNLRDSQGNCVPRAGVGETYGFLMHNWCCVFEFGL